MFKNKKDKKEHQENSEYYYENIQSRLHSRKDQTDNDLWRQLKKVSIPAFIDDKCNYEAWKAALMACVDKTPTSTKYMLLQLLQYLSGQLIKVAKSLGYSATAHQAAKERMERK